MLAAYRRYAGLTAAERHLVLEAAIVMTVVRVSLIAWSVRGLHRLLSVYTGRSTSPPRTDGDDVARIQWAVAVSARRIHGATCLVQALTADALLRRRGFASEVCVGVRMHHEHSPSFEAHAWVRCNEQVVVGAIADGSGFTELARFTQRPGLS